MGRTPGKGNGYPLQYSGLKNSRDCIVQGVAKSQTQIWYFMEATTEREREREREGEREGGRGERERHIYLFNLCFS